MEVHIEIIAMDRENGVKKTIKETVQVPKAVLAVHQMFAEEGNPGALVTAIAQSVYGGARKELDAGRKNQRTAMNEMVQRTGGRIGGSRPARPAPMHEAAPGAVPAHQPEAPMDPLAASLGLDLIQRAHGHPSGLRAAPVAAPTPGPQPSGPVVGFPPGHPGFRG